LTRDNLRTTFGQNYGRFAARVNDLVIGYGRVMQLFASL